MLGCSAYLELACWNPLTMYVTRWMARRNGRYAHHMHLFRQVQPYSVSVSRGVVSGEGLARIYCPQAAPYLAEQPFYCYVHWCVLCHAFECAQQVPYDISRDPIKRKLRAGVARSLQRLNEIVDGCFPMTLQEENNSLCRVPVHHRKEMTRR
jgi:hypothetical protein